jgi:hypothetical protein
MTATFILRPAAAAVSAMFATGAFAQQSGAPPGSPGATRWRVGCCRQPSSLHSSLSMAAFTTPAVLLATPSLTSALLT